MNGTKEIDSRIRMATTIVAEMLRDGIPYKRVNKILSYSTGMRVSDFKKYYPCFFQCRKDFQIIREHLQQQGV